MLKFTWEGAAAGMNKKVFYDEIPLIRSIACMMVVLVHVTAHNYRYDLEQFSDSLSLMLNQLSRLGTPMFAVISAFLLFRSVQTRGFHLSYFVRSRMVKIVLPYIIWTFLYLLYRQYHGANVFAHAKSVLQAFILGTGYSHLYFVMTVIQFYILFPLLQMVRDRKILLVLFVLSLPVNAIWLVPELRPHLGAVDWIVSHRSFIFQWISYFLFGGLLAYYYEQWTAFAQKYWRLLLAAFALVWCGILIEIEPDRLLTSSRPANLLYVPVSVLALIMIYYKFLKNRWPAKALTYVGNFSMGIYLIHPFVIAWLRRSLPSSFWVPSLIWIVFGLTMLISLALLRLIASIPYVRAIAPIAAKKQSS